MEENKDKIVEPMRLDYLEKIVKDHAAAMVKIDLLIRSKDILISELKALEKTQDGAYDSLMALRNFNVYDLHTAYLAGVIRGGDLDHKGTFSSHLKETYGNDKFKIST